MANSPEVEIGSKIRRLRKRAKLTISQLAELSDLDVSFLNHLELGKRNPTLGTLVKLAKALHVPVKDVVADLDAGKDDLDYQVMIHLKALLHRRNASEKADILAILKQLHDIDRVRALRRVIR